MVRLNASSIVTGLAGLAAAICATTLPARAQSCAVTEDQRFVHPGPSLQFNWFGRVIAASGDWVIAGVRNYQQSGIATGAAYMLKKVDGQWTIVQTLLAPDGASGDVFGTSVDIDGPWAVVGAMQDDHSGLGNEGSVHVFALVGQQWVHSATLTGSGMPPSASLGQRFGAAVAVSGNVILVGAPSESTAGMFAGAAYVFEFDGAAWVQQQQIFSSATPPTTSFGESVALDGDRALVSRASPWGLPTAAAHVEAFQRSNGAWAFEQLLTPGSGVFAIDGDRAVIGRAENNNAGAFIYEHDGSAWNMMQQLSPIDPDKQFGAAVAIENDRVLVGEAMADATYEYPTYAQSVLGAGRAYQFRFNGARWVEFNRMQPAFFDNDTYLVEPDHFEFGYGVAIAGEEAVIGAPTSIAPEPPMLFSFSLEPDDCDANGVPDRCDPDCNLNLANDACEIASGAAGDCNANVIPDACEQPAPYQLDDGTGASVHGLFQNGADFIWLNQFNVLPGAEHVTHISLIWTAFTPEGLQGSLMLYDDPDNDGDPNDAVLLASRPLTGRGVFGVNLAAFTIERIERTFVGNAGESFFVGVYMPSPIDASHAVNDGAPPLQRSWWARAPLGQGNIVDLSANIVPPTDFIAGNWMIRALALDCNGNGVWDQCDIDSGASFDLNANGIPDECDAPCPADINSSGGVDVTDLLAVINAWGPCPPPCAADVNADGEVNVTDLLAVINAWGACP